MNDKATEYLTKMLEGCARNLDEMDKYISNAESQLEAARAQRETAATDLKELENLLGVANSTVLAEELASKVSTE